MSPQVRLFAHPTRPNSLAAGGAAQVNSAMPKAATFSELKALWEKHATGPAATPGVSTVAAAIALAESGGRQVVNSIGATGYWQIYPGNSSLLNPDANAAAAVAKFNASVAAGKDGFNPWTTYTGADTPGHRKTYLDFLPKGASTPNTTNIQDTGFHIPNPLGGVKKAVDTAGDIGSFLGKLSDPHLWLRIGMVIGGFLCMALGLVFFGLQFMEKAADKLPPIPLPA